MLRQGADGAVSQVSPSGQAQRERQHCDDAEPSLRPLCAADRVEVEVTEPPVRCLGGKLLSLVTVAAPWPSWPSSRKCASHSSSWRPCTA